MNVEIFHGSGITAGHERYLLPSTKGECLAIAPGSIPFERSRLDGHDGDHAAHGSREPRRQFARWPKGRTA